MNSVENKLGVININLQNGKCILLSYWLTVHNFTRLHYSCNCIVSKSNHIDYPCINNLI